MNKPERKEVFDINEDIKQREAKETVTDNPKKENKKLGASIVIVIAMILIGVFGTITIINQGREARMQSEQTPNRSSETKITKQEELDSDDYISSTGLLVGDTVKYIPTETKVTIPAKYTGANADKEISNVSKLGNFLDMEDYYIDTWKVLTISKDGTAELISNAGTTSGIELLGETGYTYAPRILSLLANQLYSDRTRDITARNMDLKDLIKKVKSSAIDNTEIRISNGEYIVDENYNLKLEKEDFVDPIYYSILVDDPNTVDTFWLATRCKTGNKLKVFFIGNSELSSYTMKAETGEKGASLSLRPIIKVDLDLITKDANKNWVIR